MPIVRTPSDGQVQRSYETHRYYYCGLGVEISGDIFAFHGTVRIKGRFKIQQKKAEIYKNSRGRKLIEKNKK